LKILRIAKKFIQLGHAHVIVHKTKKNVTQDLDNFFYHFQDIRWNVTVAILKTTKIALKYQNLDQ
jgi:hypothetical protein